MGINDEADMNRVVAMGSEYYASLKGAIKGNRAAKLKGKMRKRGLLVARYARCFDC